MIALLVLACIQPFPNRDVDFDGDQVEGDCNDHDADIGGKIPWYDDVDGDARSIDATQPQSIFVNMATTPSRSRMPPSYRSAETSFRSFITSSDAAHSIASPRAIL